MARVLLDLRFPPSLWAFDGPDDVDNGLCLCALHHKLFDKGVLGVGDGHRILVSREFVGRGAAAR